VLRTWEVNVRVDIEKVGCGDVAEGFSKDKHLGNRTEHFVMYVDESINKCI
jgi:hypothetical protein